MLSKLSLFFYSAP